MTNRPQILRSSTPGQIPAAATRLPGELWTTFPDLQLGVIDASRNAQKLIAVRFFSTLANYVAGDFVIQAGVLYFAKAAITAGAFNATQWSQVAALTDIPALYVLPTASTTVLGGVKIDGVTITINSGVISSAGLVTVSATPPSSVQNGALWYDLAGGQLYAWVNDGTSSQWVVAVNQSLGGVYLPLNGGTLTGPLTLAADPVNPLEATTKQYADTKLPLAGGTLTGPITPAGIVGVTNGSNAAAGQIGEVIQSVVANTSASLGNNALYGLTAIGLTAGDRDVYGTVQYLPSAGATLNALNAGISNSNAAIGAGGSSVNSYVTPPAGFGFNIACAPCRVNISATTQYFLMALAGFSGGTCTAGGTIRARRMR